MNYCIQQVIIPVPFFIFRNDLPAGRNTPNMALKEIAVRKLSAQKRSCPKKAAS
jgi:hypothetical protein